MRDKEAIIKYVQDLLEKEELNSIEKEELNSIVKYGIM
jgi:hypothetical protein